MPIILTGTERLNGAFSLEVALLLYREVKMQSQFASRPAGRGFSLIELLIVISILAILAALLAPAVSAAQQSVYGFLCLSNLRQIGTASTLYQQDYDERYVSPSREPYHWLPDLHQAYLKKWRVWVCPDDAKSQAWDGQWESETFFRRTSYLWNAYVFQGDAYDWRVGIASAQISTPAMVPVWGEAYANAGWVSEAAPISDPDIHNAYMHNAYGDSLNSASDDPTAARCPVHHDTHLDIVHHGGGNYVFADGHARWLKPGKFTTDSIKDNQDWPIDDRSDPFVLNGARRAAIYGTAVCPVFCCPYDFGTPPGDGDHPWFRP